MSSHATPTVSAVLDGGDTEVIERPRLEAQLGAMLEPGATGRLTMVCAGPGFGKTTLVRSWLQQVEWPVAYASFQGLHVTPVMLWRIVLGAIRSADPYLFQAVSALPVPDRPGQEGFVVDVADALASRPLLLVLDDVHCVTDVDALRELDHLLRRLPTSSRTVLVSRAEPPLPCVQDQRFSGALRQIRAPALAFTEDEVGSAFPDLSADDRHAVWAQTEGWPAMVRMMYAAMQDGVQASELWDREHDLFEYLFSEALVQGSPAQQEVLLVSSLADPAPLDLVVELTGYQDARATLDRAARRSGLVSTSQSPGGRVTHHLHPILRSYLQAELLRRGLAAERGLHRDASRWFLRHGQDLKALEHALRSEDAAHVETVMAEVGIALVNAGDAERLVSLLSAASVRVDGPWTATVRAAACLDLGRTAEARAALAGLGADPLAGELGQAVWAARSHLERRSGHASSLDLLSSPDPSNADLNLYFRLHEAGALLRCGQATRAERVLEQTVQLAVGLGRRAAHVEGLSMLAEASSARSDFRGLAARAATGIEAAEAAGWSGSSRVAMLHVFAGWSARQTLQDSRARHHASTARDLVDPGDDPTVVLSADALHAALMFQAEEGAPADAHRLHELWRRAQGRDLSEVLVVYAATADAHFSLALGRTDRLRELVVEVRDRLGETPDVCLLEAMWEMGRGKRRLAAKLLREVVDGTPTVPLTEVEGAALLARLCLEGGDEFAGRQWVARALDVAERLGGSRPVVDAGGVAVIDCLRRQRGGWGRHEELAEALVEHATSPRGPAVALTERELDVLRQLPTMRTVEEIADSMVVSVNTVKTHLRNVYRKLDVPSRRDAVAEARRLGLL